MSDELLTAADAAAYLKKSRRAFYAWRRRHRIPSVGIGRGLRFRREDLVITDPPCQAVAPPRTITDFADAGRAHARGEAWRH